MELSYNYILIIVLSIFVACAQPTNHQHGKTNESSIQLNDGKPWPANPETTAGIQAMQSIIANVSGSPTQADCQKLESDLKGTFDQIIAQCTMTGEAHNQLHNYLMPLAEKINHLDAGTNTSCMTEVMAIKQTLMEYNNYFK